MERAEGHMTHDMECEKLLLALIIRGGNEEFDYVRKDVCRDDFHSEAHRRIFGAMEEARFDMGVFFFQGTLVANGELEAVGGPLYLAELTATLDRYTDTKLLCLRIVSLAAERKERALHALSAIASGKTPRPTA